jgi:hypothetical protein
MEGVFDDGSGSQMVVLTGPVTTVARGKGGATTGSWDTEILSMDLSGDVGGIQIEIRESPSLPSPGETRVADLGDGTFQVDSFFDVFTELSIEGGPFQPQTNGAGRITLMPIPPTVILPSPGLPPESDPADCDRLVSQYEGAGVQAAFPSGIDLSDTILRCFENVQRTTDPASGDETETFDATMEGVFDDGSGSQMVVLTGPVTTVARGKGGATTGSWDTEILSMDLSGDVGGIPIEIRESPSLPSPGHTRVLDLGDGTFQIDSFFDVFTEISVAGGPFQPQTNEAGRITLVPVDSDGDGVPDPDDKCPGFDDNVDTDGDTVPDGCDFCPDGDDRADLSGNQLVNFVDFAWLEADFGCTTSCTADINGDGSTDMVDAGLLFDAWLCGAGL